jgi:hypothetical protein
MSHPAPVSSINRIRAKIYGEQLLHADYVEILRDRLAGGLSDIAIAAFLTGCADSNDIDVASLITAASHRFLLR